MNKRTFRVPVCHAPRELIVQFAIKSRAISKKQRRQLLLGGVK
ncbi:hypothetical protein [Enterovibrio nigricans]|uniref:Uncharacterized protein n=1 Tax=Enterovibrio nigricans DSM 22720 TaxID=1121868 RepID=A0A1T4V8G1_9GAMM|nr:hypothetical protein [Enterovibrio nigricans]SKA61227.1 hypothetical protein SAMN02745132_03442 [Enterovibrio nigricans DSM 22720]